MFVTGLTILITLITFAAIAFIWLRRRPRLPPHLTPFFKNAAALKAFTKEERAAEMKRKEELIDPVNAEEAAEYISLHGYEVATPIIEKAILMVESNLNENPSEFGQLLGEIYACSKAFQHLEKAYYLYFIGLSQDGYSVGIRDINHDPPHYCGLVGDFRNESLVSELVTELGWDTIEQIEQNAREWLSQNSFTVQEFLNQE